MEYKLLPGQREFLSSLQPICVLNAGIGYGKSWVLAHFILKMITKFPKTKGLIVANTYTQLSNATVPALTGLLDDLGIEYQLVMSGARKHITVGSSQIFLYSLEQYDNVRGIQVGWIAGDEIAYSCREALNVIFGRLRDNSGPLYARFVSSPRGFNWWYEFCSQSNVKLITGKTKDNTNLPPEYYSQLVELYGGEDSPLARQELFGEFVNLTSGQVYFSFKREVHVSKVELDKNHPVYVGIDFNIGNMSLIYSQWINNRLLVSSSIKLTDTNANTFDAAVRIKTDLIGYNVKVIPDSTGKARKTSSNSSKSDIQILKDYGLNVLETSNPRIKDRQNTLNLALIRNEVSINESCRDLVKELETYSHDDIEGSTVHLSVALGYILWKLNPLKTPQLPNQNLSSPFLR